VCDRYDIPLPLILTEILQLDKDDENDTDRETDKKQDKSTS